MPQQNYALVSGEPEYLQIEWEKHWHPLIIRYDGQVVEKIEDREELRTGVEIPINDGTLKAQLIRNRLHLAYDGIPIPNSPDSKEEILSSSYQTIYIIGIFNVFKGIVSLPIGGAGSLQDSVLALVYGVIMIGLGYTIQTGSILALQIATGLFLLDTLNAVIVASDSLLALIGEIIVRGIFLVILVQAIVRVHKKDVIR